MKEKNHIKILILVSILLILFIIINSFVSIKQYKEYSTQANIKINNLIYLIKEKTNITDDEIFNILNSDIEDIVHKYGIDINNDSILLEYNGIKNNYLKINTLLLIIYTLVIFLIYLYYHNKDRRKINEITNYIKEINRKNYYLDILDNNEDELSLLKNELYKITIMLKEQTENLKKDKVNLKDSISDISHQLKTPLTSISILLDDIIENPNMDKKTKDEFLYSIRKEVNNIQTLVQNLLKLSKFDANVIEFKNEKINVLSLLNKAVDKIEIIRELKGILINIDCDDKTYINGDFIWEVEALSNILKNSIEYSNNNSIIDIIVEDNHFYVKITISDYGIGMSELDLKNIFKRFYKGENSISSSVGIGLNLSKKIIEKDNGFIIASSVKNSGTTFEIKYMKN